MGGFADFRGAPLGPERLGRPHGQWLGRVTRLDGRRGNVRPRQAPGTDPRPGGASTWASSSPPGAPVSGERGSGVTRAPGGPRRAGLLPGRAEGADGRRCSHSSLAGGAGRRAPLRAAAATQGPPEEVQRLGDGGAPGLHCADGPAPLCGAQGVRTPGWRGPQIRPFVTPVRNRAHVGVRAPASTQKPLETRAAAGRERRPLHHVTVCRPSPPLPAAPVTAQETPPPGPSPHRGPRGELREGGGREGSRVPAKVPSGPLWRHRRRGSGRPRRIKAAAEALAPESGLGERRGGRDRDSRGQDRGDRD